MDWSETPVELARAWAEQPVIIPGQHGELYGIFTPPAPEVSPAGICAILFSRNRWWCDRLSVKGARWLASRGFACLRFDYHGFGESEGNCGVIDGDRPFTEDALAAIHFMRKAFAQQRFVLSGFCLDGRTALSAIRDEGDCIEAVVCSSPEVTSYPGDVLNRMITLEKTRTFLLGSASFKKITLQRALRRCLNLVKFVLEQRPGENLIERQISANFKRDFQALVRSKTRCLFLQGRDDPQYHAFQLVERTLLARLNTEQRARITVEVWPGKIHLLEDPDVLRKVAERSLAWIDAHRSTATTVTDNHQVSAMPKIAGSVPA
jgi:pimeloyl-ACP methyl ester carboxylesterase